MCEGPGVPGLVSVVIPTFNREQTIGAAIESVFAQSYRPIEVIVADDGSTDRTREVVGRYGHAVHYVYQENAGASAARNLGFMHARGEFIALQDSDDTWVNWKLDAQVHLLQAFPTIGMVWTDMARVNEQREVQDPAYLRKFQGAFSYLSIEEICELSATLGMIWPDAPAQVRAAPFYTGSIFRHMLRGNLMATPTVLLRRERLRHVGGFDETLQHTGEDYEFHLHTCYHGPVGYLDAATLHYRVGATDQLTAPHLEVHGARNNLVTVLRWLEKGGDQADLPRPMIRDRLAHAYGWLGELELLQGDIAEGRAHLWQSVRRKPLQTRKAALLLLSLLPARAYRWTRSAWYKVKASKGSYARLSLRLLSQA